jgi:uncharacterized lipoprotein YajG
MNMKIVILLLLVASFALFGCAKKGQTSNVTSNLSAAQGGTALENTTGSAGTASSGSHGNAGVSGDKNGNLSDLFNIDTDKPLGNEGFDTGTPSSDK